MSGKYARITAISPRPEGTYRFAARMRAVSDMDVTIQALGSWGTFHVTTSWAQYEIIIQTPQGDNIDIYPLADTALYVEQVQLNFSDRAYDWRPAPEDDADYTWTSVAQDEVTISRIREVSGHTEYYLLQDASAAVPVQPTTNPPGGNWTRTEPDLDTTSETQMALYRCWLTEYSDGTFEWSEVSLSSTYKAITTYHSEVQQLLNSWSAQVLATTVNGDTGETLASRLGRIEVTETTVSHLIDETRATAEGLDEKITSLQEQTSDAITTTFTEAKQYADEQYGASRDYVTTAQAWQRFSANGIEQGKLGSPFKTVLDNEELGFYENNQRVAYINNNKLMITNGQILDTLQLGNFSIVTGANGLGIVWSGGIVS